MDNDRKRDKYIIGFFFLAGFLLALVGFNESIGGGLTGIERRETLGELLMLIGFGAFFAGCLFYFMHAVRKEKTSQTLETGFEKTNRRIKVICAIVAVIAITAFVLGWLWNPNGI